MSANGEEKSRDEKGDTIVVEVCDPPDAEFGGKEGRAKLEKTLLWKLDIRMSCLGVIFILNYIDRNNAAAARLKGFERDLHLHGQQFSTVLSILYVGYCPMQVPSNILLNYIGRPSLYIPACVLIWGMISALTGSICIKSHFAGALVARLFLGVVEAAFFPGALFLISKWYKACILLEIHAQMAYFTHLTARGNCLVSNAFGGLLAAGILSGMEGVLGHAAWRWLYYIEGSLTIATAIVAIFMLPDFPGNTKWLSPLERKLAEKRMSEDGGGMDDEDPGGAYRGFILAVSDWKVWWFTMILFLQLVALSFNIYFPTLTATLGFSTTVTLLLTAPPWSLAAASSLLLARHSDKTQERFFHITGSIVTGLVGSIIAISTQHIAARYVSLFLMAQAYGGLGCSYTWMSNSFPRPTYKRAAALALMNGLSNSANIVGSPITWGPSYRNSFWVCFTCAVLSIAMCFVFRQHLMYLNQKSEEGNGDSRLGKAFRYTV
ncbi:sugar transporter [Gautieria morchelliformis]|nr:sugar transporter [Gautieria morchelliformis]